MSSGEDILRYLNIIEFLMEPMNPSDRQSASSGTSNPSLDSETANPLVLSQNKTIKKLSKEELQTRIQVLLDVQTSDFDEIAKYVENTNKAAIPKAPRSPFDIFSETRKPSLMAENVDSTQGEVLKKLWKEFNKLSNDAKGVYENIAKNDKERFEKEQEVFVGKPPASTEPSSSSSSK